MAGAYGDDDYQPQSYQDDLVTDDDAVDPAMADLTENPADELGVDEVELGEEIAKLEIDDEDEDLFDDDEDIKEDERELIEDMDDEDGALPANER